MEMDEPTFVPVSGCTHLIVGAILAQHLHKEFVHLVYVLLVFVDFPTGCERHSSLGVWSGCLALPAEQCNTGTVFNRVDGSGGVNAHKATAGWRGDGGHTAATAAASSSLLLLAAVFRDRTQTIGENSLTGVGVENVWATRSMFGWMPRLRSGDFAG